MRKLMLTSVAAVATMGLGVAAQAATVTFNGTVGAEATPPNGTPIPGVVDPMVGGEDFQIQLDIDEDGTVGPNGDFTDALNGAMVTIGGADGDPEYSQAFLIDVPSSASDYAMDQVTFNLVSTEGELAGNFSIGLTFANDVIDGDFPLRDMLTNLSQYVTAHFVFNFGGFKYDGTLDDGGVVVEPIDPIPLPGAAVFMLSGLAAAGAATARRRKTA
ncbi:hypothetical protein [Parvularcula oceani]|uniref:hypothetical protein n=1 Tax=Parvularcula oceani TaxID=1247963 RepID=UPI0012DC8398|nr:hypothetical protein [Parvularcula oceani]